MIPARRFPRSPGRTPGDEQPLRSELFSADQMKHHGKSLAESHGPCRERAPDRLLSRLAENERVLAETRDLVTEAVTTDRRITPAGEWLLDNFYLIEEQVRTARRHLPKGYSRELPALRRGPSAGYPRVYDIALETIAHGDGRVDPENLSSFVAAYQSASVLKLGELWAIPIMLRLALIENLRRVAARIAADRIDRNRADHWADKMTGIAENDPNSLILMVADMARSDPPMVSSFIAEFARRLQGRHPSLALPLTWIEQRLAQSGLTIEQLVQQENQQQAADQVSIGNSIGSLRFLGATDWREFVETMSVVEATLRRDPGGVYGRMDFVTRDRYRHAVERIAGGSALTEAQVAQLSLDFAQAGATDAGGRDRTSHVGYYLIDRGLPQLERAARMKRSAGDVVRRAAGRHPLLAYLGPILLIGALLTGGLAAAGLAADPGGPVLVLTVALSLLCASQLAVALVNWLAALIARPHLLPRLDYSTGIPPESRALAVVPTMITSLRNIEELAEALEVRFLANRDGNLNFGLLTDFADADEESQPQDAPLLRFARERIEGLNDKYRQGSDSPFFLFHRPRTWNPRERLWMGHERKRGKLADLNALLRGAPPDRFALVVGRTEILPNVRYVITLDTDTQLPRDTARQFVATMAHPLNRPRYDGDRARVVEGYGILQPRVAASLPGSNRSRYARLCGGEPGLDPYTRAVSDVYQDLFHEGSFIGKGIYDVDAFERALGGRFPENRILSHDLLEGCYARSGLLSDVQLYEDYPGDYLADTRRRHRWIRGDWQLLAWLWPLVPDAEPRRRRNTLSALSRWKLGDNLRRSLAPPALTLLLLLGWTVLAPAWFWTLAVIGIVMIPPLAASLLDLSRKSGDVSLAQHLAATARTTGRHFSRATFSLACLPHEAHSCLDAILRTIRRLIARRRLLEWNPSCSDASDRPAGLAAFLREMWAAPAIAVATLAGLAYLRPDVLAIAGPVLGLWLISPAVAWWLSRPLTRRQAVLTDGQQIFLRKLARRTWAFFETFVGPDDHWLPPDNFQELTTAKVAHRTSPTNMGLSLLSNLAAYDFGYIPAGQLIERTSRAFDAMDVLDRHRGHFYNWYDTQTLEPLPPLYVSTVDSGNLAGHLLTLRPGLLELPDQRIAGARSFEGLDDTLRILADAADGRAAPQLAALRAELATSRAGDPATLQAVRSRLVTLAASAAAVASAFADEPAGDAAWWADALVRQCTAAVDELARLAPWTSQPAVAAPGPDAIPTLRELAARAGPDGDPARERMAAVADLAHRADEIAQADYGFLYDEARHVLAVGYNVAQRRLDDSYYDLLASEARLASFVGIAR
ncbi:MAG: cyclic beta 1-2 glucan synthetase, partial [bacterium]|nr:cyclic beta 1-2 glucan synthetase [bacterium]